MPEVGNPKRSERKPRKEEYGVKWVGQRSANSGKYERGKALQHRVILFKGGGGVDRVSVATAGLGHTQSSCIGGWSSGSRRGALTLSVRLKRPSVAGRSARSSPRQSRTAVLKRLVIRQFLSSRSPHIREYDSIISQSR